MQWMHRIMLVAALALAACDGPPAGNNDSGHPPPDAGSSNPGNPDAGNPDAGNPDAGNPDAGNPDAGNPDAGNPDAGNPDAGGDPNAMALTSLSPASTARATSDSATLQVVIGGRNLGQYTELLVNGLEQGWTEYVNPTVVRATFGYGVLGTAGDVTLALKADGVVTNALTFSVTGMNPEPIVFGMQPDSLPTGTGASAGTISGVDFTSRATVAASNGQTSYTLNAIGSGAPLNSQTIAITLPEEMLASAGNWTITVTNPAPGGGSRTVYGGFTVFSGNPVPIFQWATPSQLAANGGDQAIVVHGSGFNNLTALVATGSGASIPVTAFTPTTLSATIPAALTTSPGPLGLRLTTPAPGGGVAQFELPVVLVPSLTSVSPSTVAANTDNVLTLTGTNLQQASGAPAVRLYCPGGCAVGGGLALPYMEVRDQQVTVVSDTQWTATVPASYLPTTGTWGVEAGYNGVMSNRLNLTVQ